MQHHEKQDIHKRTIKSFVKRAGRLTPGQKKALETLLPRYGLQPTEQPWDFKEIFGNEQPVMMEIGFGMGHALLQLALTHPPYNFIGVEVYSPGVGALLHQVETLQCQQIRVCLMDVHTVLANIPDNTLTGIYIFFPDPWHKKRHHKRRLIQPDFIAALVKKLKPSGFIHLATDWEDYAKYMLTVCSQNENLQNQSSSKAYVPRPPDRPLTKYEKRGQHLGHQVWDLYFIKIENQPFNG